MLAAGDEPVEGATAAEDGGNVNDERREEDQAEEVDEEKYGADSSSVCGYDESENPCYFCANFLTMFCDGGNGVGHAGTNESFGCFSPRHLINVNVVRSPEYMEHPAPSNAYGMRRAGQPVELAKVRIGKPWFCTCGEFFVTAPCLWPCFVCLAGLGVGSTQRFTCCARMEDELAQDAEGMPQVDYDLAAQTTQMFCVYNHVRVVEQDGARVVQVVEPCCCNATQTLAGVASFDVQEHTWTKEYKVMKPSGQFDFKGRAIFEPDTPKIVTYRTHRLVAHAEELVIALSPWLTFGDFCEEENSLLPGRTLSATFLECAEVLTEAVKGPPSQRMNVMEPGATLTDKYGPVAPAAADRGRAKLLGAGPGGAIDSSSV